MILVLAKANSVLCVLYSPLLPLLSLTFALAPKKALPSGENAQRE